MVHCKGTIARRLQLQAAAMSRWWTAFPSPAARKECLMIRKTAPLAAALLTLLLAGTARADFVYTFTTADETKAPNAGSLNGSFTVSDAVVAGGSITIETQATDLSFALTGSKNGFFEQTYTLANFTGGSGTYPIPVKADGSFNFGVGQSASLFFANNVGGETLNIGVTQSPPSGYGVATNEVSDSGSGTWTVEHRTSVVPEPSSVVLAILGGACGLVGGGYRRLRRQQSDQHPEPQS
jgi:hypothetical protein